MSSLTRISICYYSIANTSSNSIQTAAQEHPSEPSKITGIIIGLLGRENINGFTKIENIILEKCNIRGY